MGHIGILFGDYMGLFRGYRGTIWGSIQNPHPRPVCNFAAP